MPTVLQQDVPEAMPSLSTAEPRDRHRRRQRVHGERLKRAADRDREAEPQAASGTCATGQTWPGDRSSSEALATSAIVPSMVGVDIGCGMVAVENQLVAADLPRAAMSLNERAPSVVGAALRGRRPSGATATEPVLGRRTRDMDGRDV
jgi:hypothetical protein